MAAQAVAPRTCHANDRVMNTSELTDPSDSGESWESRQRRQTTSAADSSLGPEANSQQTDTKYTESHGDVPDGDLAGSGESGESSEEAPQVGQPDVDPPSTQEPRDLEERVKDLERTLAALTEAPRRPPRSTLAKRWSVPERWWSRSARPWSQRSGTRPMRRIRDC